MKIWSSTSDWELVLPPSRPNDYQLDIIRSRLEFSRGYDARVAVLGCTPEFRDLLSEMSINNVYVFDKSIDFYQKMSLSRVYDNDEIFVKGDWLNTLGGFKNYFDIVLSDLTAGNIEYSRRKQFYRLVEGTLKENGVFIDKYLTNENGFLTLNEIETKYINLPINLVTVNDFSCEAIFCSELQEQLGVIDTTQIYKLLNQRFNANKRMQKFIELAHYITPEDCIWYYGKKNVDYVANLALERRHDLPYTTYHNRAWVYVWRKY